MMGNGGCGFAYPPYEDWGGGLWWVRYAYPPYEDWGGGLWWVRVAYPPYEEWSGGLWWVRFAYPPYEEWSGGLWWVRLRLPTLQRMERWVMVGAASLTHPTKTGAVGCGGGGYAYPPYEEWSGGLWWVRYAYPPYKDYKTLTLMVGRVSAAHPPG